METLLSLRLPDELLHRLDHWRRHQEVPPTRQASIRHMLDRYMREHPTAGLAPPEDPQPRRKSRGR